MALRVATSTYKRLTNGFLRWWRFPFERDSTSSPSRRSLWAFAAVACGLCLARSGVIPAGSSVWFGASLALLAVAAAMGGRITRVSLWLSLVALAGGWMTLRVVEIPADSLSRWIDHDALAEPAVVRVEGMVEDWPDAVEARGELSRFGRFMPGSAFEFSLWRAEASDNRWIDVSGRVRVRVDAPASEAERMAIPGRVLRITGRVSPVRAALNPGEPDWLMLARQDGRAGTLHAPSIDLLEPASPRTWMEHVSCAVDSSLGAMRRFASRTVRAPISDETLGSGNGNEESANIAPTRRERARALLGAMLLGERSAALDPVNAAFTRLGLLHLVAISGFNLVVMAGVAMFMLRLGGERGWLEPVGVGLLITLYMLVLPMQAPIFRAGVLALVFLIAEAFGRRYDRLTLLGWVAIAALAIHPLDLWSPGFQLSFGVVAALLLLAEHTHSRLFGPTIRGVILPGVTPGPVGVRQTAVGIKRWCLDALKAQMSASLVAWCVATPIIAYHTGLVSPLAILTSLIVLPLTVVVLWVGYTALLIGAAVPPAAAIMGHLLDRVGMILVDVVMLLDRVPAASFRLPRLSVWLAAACVLLSVYWLWRGYLRDRVAWALTLMVGMWGTGEIVLGPRLAVGGLFRIDTLAVGDGSCHVLRASRGLLHDPEVVLWDCGSLSTEIGERRIPDALRALGVRRVPTVILTHAHIDHYSALPEIIGPLHVSHVLLSPQFMRTAQAHNVGPLAALFATLRDHHVEVRIISQADTMAVGSATASILWPPADRDFKDPNDASLVARIELPTDGGTRVALMTGDISREAVPSLLPADNDALAVNRLHADVLELPHHGAYIEASAELMRVVAPSVVLQSTGPTRARDQRWQSLRADRIWAVTCIDGAAAVVIDNDGRVTASTLTRAPR